MIIAPHKWKQRILAERDVVYFTPRTKKYGNAEYIACLVMEQVILEGGQINHKIARVILTPIQQGDCDTQFVISGGEIFDLMSYTHKGIDAPRAWLFGWCEEHSGPLVRFYVPQAANRFIVRGCGITFDYNPIIGASE